MTNRAAQVTVDEVNTTQDGRILMAPYGTLRVGHGNWSWAFRDAPVVRTDDRVVGYALMSNHGIPAAFEAHVDDIAVVVDVLDITDLPNCEEVLKRVDRMEFGCGYFRRKIITESGLAAWMYVMPDEHRGRFPFEVTNNDWNQEHGA